MCFCFVINVESTFFYIYIVYINHCISKISPVTKAQPKLNITEDGPKTWEIWISALDVSDHEYFEKQNFPLFEFFLRVFVTNQGFNTQLCLVFMFK